MECPLFHASALLNDYIPVTALIDNGSMAYAMMNERLAQKLGLPLLETVPRHLQGVQGGTQDGLITHVTTFSLDVGAHKTRRVFAYVVPR